MNTVTLEYFDRGGVTHFIYHEKAFFPKKRGYRIYTVSGRVPAEITERGIEAAKAYVNEQITQIVGAKKERDRIFDEKRRALNVPISHIYLGVLLEGRVICRDDEFTVDLESPVQGSEFLAWGNSFGGAMAGHKIWAEPGVLTPEAINHAKRQLEEIYKRVTGPVRDIAKKFNEEK